MEQLNFEKGSKPLYAQLQEILKQKILTNEYAPGTMIPSESQLQKMFKVSRITARQAIINLENEGYVQRERGRGTRVLYQNAITEELVGMNSFTKEMQAQGIEPGTKYMHIDVVEADERLLELFHCKPQEKLYRISRVRTGDGIPVAYIISYFPGKLNLPLDDQAYLESIYAMLDSLQISRPKHSEDMFGAICSDKEVAKKLEIQKGDAVLVRERTSYEEDGQLFEYTIAYYPGERYLYSVPLNS